MGGQILVMPDKKGWSVKRSNYLLAEFNNEDKAIDFGRKKAQTSNSALLIFDDQGKVEITEDYMKKPNQVA